MKIQNSIHIVIGIVCIGFLSRAQAVVPPPDGGYPGGDTAEGQSALLSLTTGGFNTAVGFSSLRSDTDGAFNTAIGAGTLFANTASQNTANGAFALQNNTTGSNNTAVGFGALINSTGTANIGVGLSAGGFVTTANNVICIGTGLVGANVSNSCFIGNIRGIATQNGDAIPVVIDSSGQLGTASSSRRFKKEVKPMDKTSEAILALKPVRFHYNSDKSNTPQFGLIAEEVAHVNPDLVVRDENGEIYTVRYDAVNAMLLNEFLKEHRTVQELKSTVAKQEATILQQKKDFQATAAHQQKQIETLTGGLDKVSAQLEASKPAAQIVNNP
jgi:hypothetical protein